MKSIFSNLFKNITTAKIYFFSGAILYLIISFSFYVLNFNQRDFYRSFADKFILIVKNLETNFDEKKLIINFKNGTYETNQTEPIALINYNSKITIEKNILYISKTATENDFKDKDTFAILNSQEIKINLKPEPLVFPLKGITSESQNIEINHETLKNYSSYLTEGNYGFYDLGIKLILPIKMIEILFLYLVAKFLIPFITNSILRISGYLAFDKRVTTDLSLIVTGFYMLLKNPLQTFILEPAPINVLIILVVIVSILTKSRLDKRIHLNN